VTPSLLKITGYELVNVTWNENPKMNGPESRTDQLRETDGQIALRLTVQKTAQNLLKSTENQVVFEAEDHF
jgi:hypothetical protein